jgi:hypothetical protein
VTRPTRLLLGCILALALLPPAAAGATTYNVTTESDSNSGTCLPTSCTLRQAVAAINLGGGGDAINVPAGVYPLLFGELSLQKNVTVSGAGSAATTVDGNAIGRVFNIPVAVAVRLSGLTVENGRVAGTGATQAHGGGILNAGTLTLDGVIVRDNAVVPADNTGTIPAGGGIFNSGVLHVANSTIVGNRATTLPFVGGIPEGAGIANLNGQIELTDSVLSRNVATNNSGIPEGAGLTSFAGSAHGSAVTLTRSVVEGNRTVGNGGIIDGAGILAASTDLTLLESVVSNNRATGGTLVDGGGITVFSGGNLTLERSLVANNVATGNAGAEGAGLFVSGGATDVQKIVNSTIVGNRSTATAGSSRGAGIFHFGGARIDIVSSTVSGNVLSGGGAEDKGGNLWDEGTSGSVLSLRDSIVSGGDGASGFENCVGSGIQSAGHNIDSLDQCNFHAAGDKVNTDPLLAGLANNGGATETLALNPGSPAIDAGADCPATDQRGVARPQGASCDIGAFELVPAPAPPPAAKASGQAKLRFLSATVVIDLKTGKGKLQTKCLNVAGDICDVALTLLAPTTKGKAKTSASAKGGGRHGTRVGAVKGKIAGGKTGKLSVKLSGSGLALLREQSGHRLEVTASGKSKNRAKQSTAVKKKLTLKGKAPKGKKRR